jgi:aminopeptidase N
MKIYLKVLLIFFYVNIYPQFGSNESGGKLYPEIAAYDVKFYEINLEIFPDEKSIKGYVTVDVEIVNYIENLILNLDSAYTIDSILWDKSDKLSYQFDERKISIKIPEKIKTGDRFSVSIYYGGKPRVAKRPPWDDGFTWAKTADGKPWIGVTCQGGGADIWFPCKDHPSDEPDSASLIFTVPDNLICASNGKLREIIDNKNGTKTFKWFVSNPINNYGISLNIAPYDTIHYKYESITGEIIPVTIWVLPESMEKAKAHTPQFIEHLKFFEEICGPYPFRTEKYGVAETPYLGMEHQTIIAYGYGYKNNTFGFDWLHHHELAHEWWGNLVTAKDWSDFWIHEALGGYMQSLYAERLHGFKSYQMHLAGMKGWDNKQPVAPRDELSADQAYVRDMYAKGAWIIHTLRYYLGDETFFKVLRRWAYPDPEMEKATDGSQCRLATTDEFLEIAEKVSGKKLDWYFEAYFRQASLPKLITEKNGNKFLLKWEVENNIDFILPIEVSVNGIIQKVDMKKGSAEIEVTEDAKIIVDPKNWITMEYDY